MEDKTQKKVTLPCRVTFDVETGQIVSAQCDISEIVQALGSPAEVATAEVMVAAEPSDASDD